MSVWAWLLLSLLVIAVLWALGVLGLIAVGRGGDAKALARFIPDCVVLFKRLMTDARVPRSAKAVVGLSVVYLVSPIDVVPDFIPVAGQLDDAILVMLVLRFVARRAGPEMITELWPGPPQSLAAVMRVSFGAASERSASARRTSGRDGE